MSSFLGKIDKTIFGISAVVCLFFVLWGAIFPVGAGKSFQLAMTFVTDNFGWTYMIVVSCFLVFITYIAFSKYGKITLGKDGDKPDFSTSSWFAMLFSGAMGIGLLFYGVAEPMTHYLNPPFGDGSTIESASTAMRYTFMHWGLHPWAGFALTGLAMAYFQFRKGLPALVSSTLHPLIGDKGISGPIGKTVDILAVFATIFGVATSLGLGALQINGGLEFLFKIPKTTFVTLSIIVVITLCFVISALSGLNKGIRILSNLNLILFSAIMIIVIFLGPARFILNVFTDTIGTYMQNIIQMSFYTDPYGVNPGWTGGWTIFYWAWWIAFCPFVGAFIARISKGRSVREFIVASLLAPVLLSFIWFSIMGATGLNMELTGAAAIGDAVSADITSALFVMLDNLRPLGALLSIIACLNIATFFITCADSATFVMAMLTSGGNLEPKGGLKVFWGITEGSVAMVLLLAGGLGALQTASLVAAFPFMIVMILMCFSLIKGFSSEFKDIKIDESKVNLESRSIITE